MDLHLTPWTNRRGRGNDLNTHSGRPWSVGDRLERRRNFDQVGCGVFLLSRVALERVYRFGISVLVSHYQQNSVSQDPTEQNGVIY